MWIRSPIGSNAIHDPRPLPLIGAVRSGPGMYNALGETPAHNRLHRLEPPAHAYRRSPRAFPPTLESSRFSLLGRDDRCQCACRRRAGRVGSPPPPPGARGRHRTARPLPLVRPRHAPLRDPLPRMWHARRDRHAGKRSVISSTIFSPSPFARARRGRAQGATRPKRRPGFRESQTQDDFHFHAQFNLTVRPMLDMMP